MDLQQHHCHGCRCGGGVDRRRAVVARCLADVIHSHSGTKVFIEQEVLALTRVVNGPREHARMDLVFNLNGSVTYLDVSIVALFSCNQSLVSAASTRPGHMARRAEKTKFDRTPTHKPRPFHTRDHRPTGATRQKIHQQPHARCCEPPGSHQGHMVSCPKCAPQCHLQTTTHSRRYVTPVDHCHSLFYLCRPRYVTCQYRPNGKSTQRFQTQANRSRAMCPAAATHLPMMTSTTLATLCYICWPTPTLRQSCSPVSLTLMCSTQPLDADSLWTLSLSLSSIVPHLILSHCLLMQNPALSYGATPSLLRT